MVLFHASLLCVVLNVLLTLEIGVDLVTSNNGGELVARSLMPSEVKSVRLRRVSLVVAFYTLDLEQHRFYCRTFTANVCKR